MLPNCDWGAKRTTMFGQRDDTIAKLTLRLDLIWKLHTGVYVEWLDLFIVSDKFYKQVKPTIIRLPKILAGLRDQSALFQSPDLLQHLAYTTIKTSSPEDVGKFMKYPNNWHMTYTHRESLQAVVPNALLEYNPHWKVCVDHTKYLQSTMQKWFHLQICSFKCKAGWKLES